VFDHDVADAGMVDHLDEAVESVRKQLKTEKAENSFWSTLDELDRQLTSVESERKQQNISALDEGYDRDRKTQIQAVRSCTHEIDR